MSGLNWGGDADGPSLMDDKLAVRFYTEAVEDVEASKAAGRRVCKDVPHVEIGIPGDKLLISVHPVTDEDKRRFRREWAAFELNAEGGGLVGTPLADWPGVTRAQAEELAYFRVRTVEQLSTLADANALNVGPIQALKRKAQDWLDKAKTDAPFERLRNEGAEKDARMAVLEQMLQKQAEAIAALQGSKPLIITPAEAAASPKAKRIRNRRKTEPQA